MTPTPEQEEIRAAAKRPSDGSLMISAYAGCAKSTTLELAAQEIKVPGLSLAFNLSIKNELAERMPPNFKVQTMNGMGFGALMRAMPNVNFAPPDTRKVSKLINGVAKESGADLSSDQWDAIKRLVSSAMASGLVPKDEGRNPLMNDSEANWQRLADDQYIDPKDFDFHFAIAYEVLRRNNELVRQGQISFDDQVYYSTCIEGKFPLFPVMMVDEAQDLSPLNHAMLEQAMRPDGRLLVVGDPKQAIYAFRGADSASMAKLRRLRPQWRDLPLTLTFRCPKIVVGRQERHAPGFRAAESNLPGHFARVGVEDAISLERSWDWSDVAKLVGERRLAIICRNNAPLMSMTFKLLRKRVSVRVLGRDIGTGLIALSRKLFPEDHTSRDEMLGKLGEWIESEVSTAEANDKPELAERARDRGESLRAVISFGEVEDASRLRFALKALFEREDGQVTLSSIHKAKGLEWDAVLHLDPWRIPSKWAVEAAKAGDGVQLQQEYNLLYVCETRTKDLLLEADLKEMI